MRINLTTVLLIATFLQVTAAGYAQKITFVKKDATLKQVFSEIHKQTGFSVLLSGTNAKSNDRVEANFKNSNLEDVLKKSLSKWALDYAIEDKMIVIRDRKNTLSNFLTKLLDTSFLVTGRIVNELGRPLPGASFSVTNKEASVTGYVPEDGRFKFYAKKGDKLTISYIGYLQKQIKITEGNLGDLILKQKTDSLEEVKIVIGYGTTTELLTTGNVAVITSEDIAKQPVANVLQALQNNVPGMMVTQTNGFASSSYNLKIRGQNAMSVRGTNGVNNMSEPLYIIDGVPIISGASDQQNVGINQNGNQGPTGGQSPMYGINPSDIESISILKDADATAIYGARGANGVILITTKKGKEGNTTVTANVYSGLSLQTKKLNLMNTEQYLAMRKQAFLNDNQEPQDYDGYDLKFWDQSRYTDWQKEFLKTARTTDAQLSLSGGDSKTTFRLSGGFNRTTPPFKGDYKEQRASGSINVNNTAFNDRLQTSGMLNFSSTSNNLPSQDPTSLVFLAPNAPALLNDEGDLNFEGWRTAGMFPYSAAYLKRPYEANTVNLISNLTLKYQILPGLAFNTSLGYNITRQKQFTASPSGSFDPLQGQTREARFGTNNSRTWIIEPSITWTKKVNDHSFETLFGATFQDMEIEGTDITAQGFTSDAMLQNLGAASGYYARNNYINTKFQSLYARLNYNYKTKYIVNLNGRRDGSSRFASGKQFGNFGSVGAAWIFSRESFFENNLRFLSMGKIRASYGLVGGDGLGDYQYLASFSSGQNPYQGTPVLQLARLANDTFGWTTNKKAEIAIDLAVMNGKISTSIAWYRNRSGNQLVSESLPATTGFPSVITNLPALIENSGLELTLTSHNMNTNSFSWTSDFNISRNHNKLLEFPNIENSVYKNLYAIGRSINSLGMLHYTGINPETGEYMFADINGDGEVDIYGTKDYLYKDNTAGYFGGLSNTFSYQNFSLSIFLAFTKQRGRLRLSNQYPGSISGGLGNQLVLEEQFSGKPPLEALTSVGYSNNLFNYYNSDATWVDASYIRLQNLSFSYTLPSKLLQKVKVRDFKVYVQGQNLMTITGYKGTDPATPASFSLPPRKIITAGIQFVF